MTRSSAAVAVVGTVLVAAAPDPSTLRAGLADPEAWVVRDGLDLVLGQVVGAIAWLLAMWLAVGFLLVAGSRLPGLAGRTSAALARGALPAGLRRTAAVALGASLATSALPVVLSSAAAEGWDAPSAAASTTRPEVLPDRLPSRAEILRPAAATDALVLGRLLGPPAAPASHRAGPARAGTTAAIVDRALGTPGPAEDVVVDRPTGRAAGAASAAADHRPGGAAATVSGAAVVDWPVTGASAADRPAPAARADGVAVDWPVDRTAASADRSATTARADGAVVDWPIGKAAASADRPAAAPADGVVVDWPINRTIRAAADQPAAAPSDGVAVDRPINSAAGPVPDRPTAASADGVAVDRPVARPASAPADGVVVEWPLGRSASGGSAGRAPVAPYSAAVGRGGTVVVAPGDTLWSIASRHLGPGATAPAVAAEWRRWHAANRTLIGPDPRRLRPGVTLHRPTRT